MGRVLIVSCGVGFGHATRAWSVIKNLQAHDIEFKTVSTGDGAKFLREKGTEVTEIEGIEWSTRAYRFSLSDVVLKNVVALPRLTKSLRELSNVIKAFKPDVILSDSDPLGYVAGYLNNIRKTYVLTHLPLLAKEPTLPPAIYKRCRRSLLYFSLFDAYLSNHSAKIIAPVLHRYDISEERYLQTNPIVRTKPRKLPSKEEIIQKRALPEDFFLVPIPGAPVGKGLLLEVIHFLKEHFPEQHFVVTNFPSIGTRRQWGNITLFPYVQNFLEFLKATKGIITLAGYSTVTECFVYETPMLAIPERRQIEHIITAHIIASEGFGRAIYPWEREKGFNTEDIRAFITSVDDIRAELHSRSFQGNGGAQVVEFLKNQMKE